MTTRTLKEKLQTGNARCKMFPDVERTIVSELQLLFHENNDLVHLFKTAIDLMPTDTHKIVISADKTPTGEHVRRCNAPTIDEVAIVMVSDQFLPRDIILHKRKRNRGNNLDRAF